MLVEDERQFISTSGNGSSTRGYYSSKRFVRPQVKIERLQIILLDCKATRFDHFAGVLVKVSKNTGASWKRKFS